MGDPCRVPGADGSVGRDLGQHSALRSPRQRVGRSSVERLSHGRRRQWRLSSRTRFARPEHHHDDHGPQQRRPKPADAGDGSSTVWQRRRRPRARGVSASRVPRPSDAPCRRRPRRPRRRPRPRRPRGRRPAGRSLRDGGLSRSAGAHLRRTSTSPGPGAMQVAVVWSGATYLTMSVSCPSGSQNDGGHRSDAGDTSRRQRGVSGDGERAGPRVHLVDLHDHDRPSRWVERGHARSTTEIAPRLGQGGCSTSSARWRRRCSPSPRCPLSSSVVVGNPLSGGLGHTWHAGSRDTLFVVALAAWIAWAACCAQLVRGSRRARAQRRRTRPRRVGLGPRGRTDRRRRARAVLDRRACRAVRLGRSLRPLGADGSANDRNSPRAAAASPPLPAPADETRTQDDGHIPQAAQNPGVQGAGRVGDGIDLCGATRRHAVAHRG